MTITTNASGYQRDYGNDLITSTTLTPSVNSAVSWGAIVAGSAAGASLSLILLILGVGLGLSAVSPMVTDEIRSVNFGTSTAIWLTVTQLVASALGGYLAGRLRTKAVDDNNHEVYFRDISHGFLAWAVASLAMAILLASVLGAILNGAIDAGAQVTMNINDATEEARRTSAYAALWICVALVIGAFAASLAAIWGGKQRDAVAINLSTSQRKE